VRIPAYCPIIRKLTVAAGLAAVSHRPRGGPPSKALQEVGLIHVKRLPSWASTGSRLEAIIAALLGRWIE